MLALEWRLPDNDYQNWPVRSPDPCCRSELATMTHRQIAEFSDVEVARLRATSTSNRGPVPRGTFRRQNLKAEPSVAQPVELLSDMLGNFLPSVLKTKHPS